MSILNDIPGADRKILDYACALDHTAPRDRFTDRMHKIQRACRKVIATEPSLSAQQRLDLLNALEADWEQRGL